MLTPVISINAVVNIWMIKHFYLSNHFWHPVILSSNHFNSIEYLVSNYHRMTSSNGNIFRVTGPLCGESTGDRWIPHIKTSNAELWFFYLPLNKRWSKFFHDIIWWLHGVWPYTYIHIYIYIYTPNIHKKPFINKWVTCILSNCDMSPACYT